MFVLSILLSLIIPLSAPIQPIAPSDQTAVVAGSENGDVQDKEDEVPQKGEKEPGPDDFIPVEVMPEIVNQIAPVYPEKALKKGLEGDVWIKMLISKNGDVLKSMISKESGKNCGFEESALEASKKFKFTPALQNSQPVLVWVAQKVSFKIESKDKENVK